MNTEPMPPVDGRPVIPLEPGQARGAWLTRVMYSDVVPMPSGPDALFVVWPERPEWGEILLIRAGLTHAQRKEAVRKARARQAFKRGPGPGSGAAAVAILAAGSVRRAGHWLAGTAGQAPAAVSASAQQVVSTVSSHTLPVVTGVAVAAAGTVGVVAAQQAGAGSPARTPRAAVAAHHHRRHHHASATPPRRGHQPAASPSALAPGPWVSPSSLPVPLATGTATPAPTADPVPSAGPSPVASPSPLPTPPLPSPAPTATPPPCPGRSCRHKHHHHGDGQMCLPWLCLRAGTAWPVAGQRGGGNNGNGSWKRGEPWATTGWTPGWMPWKAHSHRH